MREARFEIFYLYRDAGNYKFRGSFVVSGDPDLDALAPFLLDRTWFVPERIGLPALRPMVTTTDDHALHEFEGVAPYEGPVGGIPAEELLRRVRSAAERDGWFRDAQPLG